MTSEERNLIDRFKNGEFNGIVGDFFGTNGGSTVWTEIRDGKATRYKEGPSKRFFNGKENERTGGALHVLAEWATDAQILEFLQKFGWLLTDKAANAYSAKFKPKKK